MYTPVSHLVLAAAETALTSFVVLFFMAVAAGPVARCVTLLHLTAFQMHILPQLNEVVWH
jgi:hypothetical protein